MKGKGSWFLILGLLVIAAILGIVFPGSGQFGDDPNLNTGDTAWMLTATALVLLMTPGLGFFYGGMINSRHIISTILQSFIAMGIVSILWVVVGFSLAFGDSIGGDGTGIIGNPLTFFMFRGVHGGTDPDLAPSIALALFAMFQLKFAIITPLLLQVHLRAGYALGHICYSYVCLLFLFMRHWHI